LEIAGTDWKSDHQQETLFIFNENTLYSGLISALSEGQKGKSNM